MNFVQESRYSAITECDVRLDIIDALRGLAALTIVFYHARPEYWIGLGNTLSSHGMSASPAVLFGYMLAPFSIGWIGVPVFFVLSGYCIHRRFAYDLAKGKEKTVDWRRFFIRRFWRIYPVYLAALVVTAIVDSTTGTGTLGEGPLSLSTFIASVLTFQGYFEPMFGSNTVFWTLSIEIHLYLFYPLLYAAARRRGPHAMLGLALAVSVAYVAVSKAFGIQSLFPQGHVDGPVFLPFVFMWTLGAFLAEIEAGRARRPAGVLWHGLWIAALLGGLALHRMGEGELSALVLALGAVGLTDIVMRWGRGNGVGVKTLVPPFVWIGICSYSLYASHRLAFGVLNRLGFEGQTSAPWKVYIAALTAVGAARLFYLLFEKPFLNIGKGVKGSGGPLTPSA